jgi:hypothetical protein
MVEAVSPKKAAILAKQFDMEPEAVINAVEQADPTKNAAFATWILKQVKDGHITLPEDGPGSKETLTRYQRLVKGNANIETDIAKFATMPDLYDAVAALSTFKSKKDVEKEMMSSGITKVLETEDGPKPGKWIVFEITTTQASAKACRGTGWCVKDPKFAVSYLKNGPLYLFLHQAPGADKAERTALASIDKQYGSSSGKIELKDPSDRELSEPLWSDVMRLLASAMGPEVAFRHLDVAIDRAIILGEQIPANMENSRDMIKSKKRPEYFAAVYPDNPKAMFEKIDEGWWMGQNATAVEYSLGTEQELPPNVKHRILLDTGEAIAYAKESQEMGIMQHWPELEADLTASPDSWQVDDLEGYNPSTRGLVDAIKHKEGEAARLAAAAAAKKSQGMKYKDEAADAATRIDAFVQPSTRVLYKDGGGWAVVEITAYDLGGVSLDRLVGLLVQVHSKLTTRGDTSKNAYNTLWSSLIGSGSNQSGTLIAAHSNIRREAKVSYGSGAASKAATAGADGDGPWITLAEYALTYKGKAVCGLQVLAGSRANPGLKTLISSPGPIKSPEDIAQYMEPLVRAAYREASHDAVRDLMANIREMFDEPVEEVPSTSGRKFPSGFGPRTKKADTAQAAYLARHGILPIRNEADLVSLAIEVGPGLKQSQGEYGSDMGARFSHINLPMDVAMRVTAPIYDRIATTWEQDAIDYMDKPIAQGERGWDVNNKLKGIITGAADGAEAVPVNWEAAIPFMRSYLEHAADKGSLDETLRSAIVRVYLSLFGNKPDKPSGKDADVIEEWESGDAIWSEFSAVIPPLITEGERLAMQYARTIRDHNETKLLPITKRRLPRKIEDTIKAEIGDTATWADYASKYLNTSVARPSIPPVDPSRSGVRGRTTPKFTVEGLSPNAFIMLAEGGDVEEVFGEGWIGVDLDGTLAREATGEAFDPYTIGSPIQTMCERVRNWLSDGRRVKIMTARVAEGDARVEQAIVDWCEEHLGQPLEVTNEKDPAMLELWDDRSVNPVR